MGGANPCSISICLLAAYSIPKVEQVQQGRCIAVKKMTELTSSGPPICWPSCCSMLCTFRVAFSARIREVVFVSCPQGYEAYHMIFEAMSPVSLMLWSDALGACGACSVVAIIIAWRGGAKKTSLVAGHAGTFLSSSRAKAKLPRAPSAGERRQRGTCTSEDKVLLLPSLALQEHIQL